MKKENTIEQLPRTYTRPWKIDQLHGLMLEFVMSRRRGRVALVFECQRRFAEQVVLGLDGRRAAGRDHAGERDDGQQRNEAGVGPGARAVAGSAGVAVTRGENRHRGETSGLGLEGKPRACALTAPGSIANARGGGQPRLP